MHKKILLLSLLFSVSSVLSAESYYENALIAFDKNDVGASYIHLKNALSENQENLPAKILMGKVLLRKGLFNEGIEEFRDAIDLGADINPFVYEMARALLFHNKFEQVLTLAQSSGLNTENKIKMLLLSNNAYQGLEKPNDALLALQHAYNLNPKRLSTITSLASYYLNQRLFIESSQYLEQALSIAPKNNRVWQLNGEFYNAQGQGTKALYAFQKAYELNPADPVVMRSLANQYAMLNKLDEALNFANKILEETPFDTYTELLKSRLLINNEQNEQAQVLLQSISSRLSLLTDVQKNNNPSIIFVSGAAAFLQGNFEQAQKDLIYYVNTRPEDLSGINMLVEIYQSQKQQEKVEALLERFEPRIKKDLFLALNLYNIYLKNNKIYRAKSLLNELERYYSNNLLIVKAKANYLVSTKRANEAIELLKQKRPTKFNGAYELNLAKLYVSITDYKSANTIADKLLTLDDKATQYLLFKGVVLSKQQQWQEAISYFDKILTINNEHFAAKYNKATALAALRKYSEAIDIISPMIQSYENNNDLLILFAKLKRDTGDNVKATEILTEILKRKPRMLIASDILFGIYYNQGNYTLALEEAQRLTKNSFLVSKYISNQAKVLTKLGRYKEANVQLGKVLGLAESAQDFYQLSSMQIEAGFFNDALSSINAAIKKESNNRFYKLQKAKLLLTLNRIDESKAELDVLASQQSNDANLRYTYGLFFIQKQQYKKAYKEFNSALRIDENFTGALLKMYMLAQQGVNIDSFESTLSKIAKAKPKNVFIQNLIADFYLANGKPEKALPHYLAIENIASAMQAYVLNNIANIYAESNVEKALSYIERAFALEKNSPDILDTYGWVLSLNGDFSGSLDKLRQATAINANNPLIQYHLGFTLQKMGRLEDAKVELTKILRMQGNFAEKGKAQQLLNKIK
ncbi:XrtA/PEP-CTERM system TPR-repeat protein PrsT [Thalassotalea atypica]|uniref:XrtA/PEP-CTERM system TPR-repeat protein PrsT n=1 Tax=Thalassotalea atypica TaxID=2054316 RepID=UPI002572D4A9|nr:XrtA/PEP-CTERM system TPR-repeat protein PrsT [Thalassotalea atypica]